MTTSGVPFDEAHPLFAFCDSGLHLACLETWPEREAFSVGYFAQFLSSFRGRPAGLLGLEEHWMLGVDPAKPPATPYFAQIVLKHWPIRLYSPWQGWTASLAGDFTEGLKGLALQAVETVLTEVRIRAATTDDLQRLLEKKRRLASH